MGKTIDIILTAPNTLGGTTAVEIQMWELAEAAMMARWVIGDRIAAIEVTHDQSGMGRLQILYHIDASAPDDGTTENAVQLLGSAPLVDPTRKFRMSTGTETDDTAFDLNDYNVFVLNTRGGPTGTTDARTLTVYELEESPNPGVVGP